MADCGARERSEAVAVIGMAGRFPAARNVEEFWRNLCRGVEGIVPLSDAAVLQAVGPGMRSDQQHVKVAAGLADIDRFDAEYFQFTPRLAEIHDPQHRVLLEVAEEALQDAGYVGALVSGETGIFVGVGSSGYAREHLYADPQLVAAVGAQQIYLATEKDFAPVLVAYKLGLTGPAAAVSCGCSSSLVSIHLAATSLLDRECDLALAGGVAIIADPNTGYRYREGGILSPDGHCRPFDAAAAGTVPASAVGIVVLKRLEDALRDGDHVEAVILGSAINNDGSDKIGFTAPSVNGQVRVVASALAVAGVTPREIGYIEAHGTATRLGDPIEVAALKEVFGDAAPGACYLGAVKSNIGHSNAASGVVGFIKAVLTVRHGLVPPTLHFKAPNPELGLADSPFTVNGELRPWRSDGTARRAGVSSFGIGGTNAHVVIEEPPPAQTAPSARQWQVLPLSAKHPDSLLGNRARLAQRLESAPDLNLPDVAFTLQTGRAHARYRCAVVASSREEALAQLRQPYTAGAACMDRLPVVLMFPGQGAQHPGMTAGLYRQEPEFREQIDRCAQLLVPALGQDIRRWILSEAGSEPQSEALADTLLAQPLIFATSYALARLLQSYGVEIAGMLGHSLGEYVAACLADVFSLEEALGLIVQRARLMRSTRAGAMLAVSATEKEAAQWAAACDIAAINGADKIVLAGQCDVINGLHEALTRRERDCRLLDVTRAFHSRLMEPIRDELVRAVARLELRAPRRRYISNLSGTWIEAQQALNPVYWGEHLCAPVRFADGLATVLSEDVALVECGPGRALSSLARRHPSAQRAQCITSLCRHQQDSIDDAKYFAGALVQLWSAGVELEWLCTWRGEQRRRVSLPTYAFRRERYWIERPVHCAAALPTVEDTWQRAALAAGADRPAPVEIVSIAREMQKRLDCAVATAACDADLNAELEALCLDYVVNALHGLGMSFACGSTFESGELARRLRVHEQQRRQFERLLEMLAEAGVLGRDDRRWTVLVEPPLCAASKRMRALMSRFPELDFQLGRCDRLWSAIPRYLTGEVDLRESMLASEGLSGTSKFYAEPPEKRLVNSLISSSIADWIAQLGAGRRARIIEIGAGTGGTTAAVLEGLPLEQVELFFTDKSRFFFAAARERFGRFAGAMTYAALDIEKDPLVQGFERHAFDIVLAANVLHATRDLREALANVRALLRPGGLLIVLEATQRLRATDLTYGFLKEWWGFTDGELRGHHPLAGVQAWRSALAQTGFCDVAAVRPGSDRVPFQHTIFAATTGSEPRRGDKTLLFAANCTCGATQAQELSLHGIEVVVVAPAQQYRRHDARTFSVDPRAPRDFERLMDDLQSQGDAPVSQVIYAWALALDGDCTVAELDEHLHAYRGALGHLCGSLQHCRVASELTIRVVTRSARCIDSPATVLGATQTAIVDEARRLAGSHARWRWQYVDLDADRTADAQRLALEASAGTSAREVCYRGGERLVRGADAFAIPVKQSCTASTGVQIAQASAATEHGLAAAIARIWRSVLGVEQLDPAGDFFAQGGDSLTAMQLVSRLRDELGVEIRVRQFLEQPRIEAVAGMIEALRASAAPLPSVEGRAQEQDEARPVSLEQRRILFLESTSKNLGALFSIPIALRIRGELDAARLRAAFERIVRRHSVLRARFAVLEGEARQYIDELGALEVQATDGSEWDDMRQLAELEQWASRPFDLGKGPLLRVQIIKLRGDGYLLLVNVHHIVADSWSIGVMGRELSALYDGAPLPELAVQYADYVHWQERFVASEELQAQLRFWQQRLAGAPVTQSFPADRPRPSTPSFRGDVLTFALPADLAAQIRALACENGSTLFAALLAVFTVLVYAQTEAEEVLVGTDTANRCRSEFEQLIGFFINVIVLRISMHGDPDVLGVLARARDTTYEAFANQSAPFDRVVASVKDARVPGFAPLFQMKFLMQNTPTAPFQLGEAQISAVPMRRASSELDLIFSMSESPGGGVQGLIEYSTDLFDAQTVRRFADEYTWLAERCAADVHSKLSEIVADLRRWQAGRRAPSAVGVRAMPSIARARKVVQAAE